MELNDTTRKIVSDISKETGIVGYEVERAVSMFFKGVAEEIKSNVPVHIRMPFLGTIYPKGEFIKRYEANNIGRQLSGIQSGSEDDKGIQGNT